MIIDFEGTKVVTEDDPGGLMPGDIYMAKRNAGWKMLTCKKVEMSFVVPLESG